MSGYEKIHRTKNGINFKIMEIIVYIEKVG